MMNRQFVEQAFYLIDTLEKRREVYRKGGDALAKIFSKTTSEFTHALQMIDGELLNVLCKHIDGLLGMPQSDLTSYYLHECAPPYGHGGRIESGGTTWTLRNIQELRAYVRHEHEMQDAEIHEAAP